MQKANKTLQWMPYIPQFIAQFASLIVLRKKLLHSGHH